MFSAFIDQCLRVGFDLRILVQLDFLGPWGTRKTIHNQDGMVKVVMEPIAKVPREPNGKFLAMS